MFCPKCGSQNADDAKYCRGCGVNLADVLAAVDGKMPETPALSEKYIELFSSGLRGVMIGAGFLIVSIIAAAISIRLAPMFLFFLAFAAYCLGTGISRLIQARGVKALSKRDDPVALSPGQTEFIKPLQSIYQTDDLTAQPLSVTEHTTRHLGSDK